MNKEEVWVVVPGYEELYSISDHGRVFAHSRKCWNGTGFFMSKEKIMKIFNARGGYLYVTLRKDNKPRNFRIHRLVLLGFCGDSHLECNHIDGDKKNNRLENLEYVTSSENKLHAWKTGLHSEEERARVSMWASRPRTDQTRLKMSESAKKDWQRRKGLI